MGNIQFAKSEGVARITLARPKHNWLNIELMKELNGHLEALLGDQDLKCVVLLGEGPSWSAGVDVDEHAPDKVHGMIATFNRIFELIDQIEVPVIAAVHGRALGGGMEVAIACDVVVAARSAVFGQPEIKLGFLPPYAAIRLPWLVGPARAVEICTTGMTYTAEQAREMGFVSRVVDDDAFAAAVEQIVAEISQASPLVIRLNKRAVKVHLGLGSGQALAGVTDLFLGTLMKTEDTLEGIASFRERRKPVWKNR